MKHHTERIVFVAFDLETTGLQPVMHRAIELSAVKFTLSGRILGEFDELINPGIPIPEASSRVHGICEEDLRNKPLAPVILEGFKEFLREPGCDVILLAHNSEFDVTFLGSEYILSGMEYPTNEIWDTLPISRALVPRIMNHKLTTLVHHFDIRADGAHRALIDSYYVCQIFQKFCAMVEELEDLKNLGNPRNFDLARNLFAVQLPLPMIKLKKSIAESCPLKFVYEGETGIREIIEAQPLNLFKDDRYSYLSAIRTHVGYPESFRLDRLSKPELVAQLQS